MAVMVDQAIWHWRGRRWAHLVSDASYDELHAFAARLGIPRRAFQGDHYDVPDDYRVEAIRLGAEAVDARVLVRRLRAAGLRRPRSVPAIEARPVEPASLEPASLEPTTREPTSFEVPTAPAPALGWSPA